MKPKIYTGLLAEPFPRREAPSLVEPENEWRRKVAELLLNKLVALCNHHGVEMKNVDLGSVFELAIRHVPGFRLAPSRRCQMCGKHLASRTNKGGRTERWNDGRLARLWILVLLMRDKSPRLSDMGALKNIAKKKDYDGITGGVGYDRLKTELRRAKKSPLVRLLVSPNPSDQQFAWSFIAQH